MVYKIGAILEAVKTIESNVKGLQVNISKLRGTCKEKDFEVGIENDTRLSVQILYKEYKKLKSRLDDIKLIDVVIDIDRLTDVEIY